MASAWHSYCHPLLPTPSHRHHFPCSMGRWPQIPLKAAFWEDQPLRVGVWDKAHSPGQFRHFALIPLQWLVPEASHFIAVTSTGLGNSAQFCVDSQNVLGIDGFQRRLHWTDSPVSVCLLHPPSWFSRLCWDHCSIFSLLLMRRCSLITRRWIPALTSFISVDLAKNAWIFLGFTWTAWFFVSRSARPLNWQSGQIKGEGRPGKWDLWCPQAWNLSSLKHLDSLIYVRWTLLI